MIPLRPQLQSFFPRFVFQAYIAGFAQAGPPAPPASVAKSRDHYFNMGASVWVSGHPSMVVHSLGMVIWTVSGGISGPAVGANVFEGLLRHTGRLMH